ncbi:MAG TPA: UV DNA damage repair endonuclease UvsE [Armatimonadota bacterium]|nr:UV DNA damage repair endonuclease UvsE [Armatimonadota bacterium]
MIRAIGYAGICLGLPERSITRTARLANVTPSRLRELIQANLTDLLAILEYNIANRFSLFRINQSIIPYASHPVNTLRWWEDDEFGPLLRLNGDFIKRNCLRVSMHPGQYTVLNSENPAVVDAAIAEVTSTCRVLDTMGLDRMHKMVVHGGAGKPDKRTALERLEQNWLRIPANVRDRLVLENDDKIFSVDILLPLCHRLRIPLVFDRLHHFANPGTWAGRPVDEIMEDVAQTWHAEDGLPKVHFSSQDPDKRPGAHAYYLGKNDFLAFINEIASFTVDVMAECKGKDLALIELRNQLGLESLASGSICWQEEEEP